MNELVVIDRSGDFFYYVINSVILFSLLELIVFCLVKIV